jgi:hypothetical protein
VVSVLALEMKLLIQDPYLFPFEMQAREKGISRLGGGPPFTMGISDFRSIFELDLLAGNDTLAGSPRNGFSEILPNPHFLRLIAFFWFPKRGWGIRGKV